MRRSRVLRSRERCSLIVTLKSGPAFRGVLFDQDREAWVLRSAEVLEAGDDRIPQPVDGELLVLVADIAYAQRLLG